MELREIAHLNVDIAIQRDVGSQLLLQALTDRGREWLASHINTKDAQRWCGGVMINPKFAPELVGAMKDDGLDVA